MIRRTCWEPPPGNAPRRRSEPCQLRRIPRPGRLSTKREIRVSLLSSFSTLRCTIPRAAGDASADGTSYFPSDADTADVAAVGWWDHLVGRLAELAVSLGCDAVCSPAHVPKTTFSDEYFASSVTVGNLLRSRLQGSSVRPIQTAIVGLNEVAAKDRALTIASVLTQTSADSIYLILVNDGEACAREVSDSDKLKGAMRLIRTLEDAQLPVLVGYCSSEMVLWKAAGASSSATGKFFNLRRFTKSRFETPSDGGSQLAYCFEESLLAFLREPDLALLRNHDRLCNVFLTNPFSEQILNRLIAQPGKAWIALGWRQFMYWFADAEHRIANGSLDVRKLLAAAEKKWLALDDDELFMEEPRNNGEWIRSWRKALAAHIKGE